MSGWVVLYFSSVESPSNCGSANASRRKGASVPSGWGVKAQKWKTG